MANPKFHSLSEHEDVFIGKPDSTERAAYEAKCATIRAAELAYSLATRPKHENIVLDTELSAELVAERIKDFRKKRNLTQAELGDLMGVTKSQVSRLESSASNATIDTIQKVFAALGFSVNIGFVEVSDNYEVLSSSLRDSQLTEVQ